MMAGFLCGLKREANRAGNRLLAVSEHNGHRIPEFRQKADTARKQKVRFYISGTFCEIFRVLLDLKVP